MAINIIKDKCIGCGLCASNCPADAIVEAEGAEAPFMITDKCVGCGLCAGNCPAEAIVEAEAGAAAAETGNKAEAKAETAAPELKEEGEKPEKKNPKKKAHINEDECIGCNLCVTICPMHCLELVLGPDCHISKLPDPDKCVGCGQCSRICPIEAISVH